MTVTPKYLSIIEQRRAALRTQLESVFGAGGAAEEFTLEVGSGHGHFLTAFAAAHPGEKCVGVDLIAERIGRAVKKRDRAKLGNLFFLQAEARLFLETLPNHARVAAAYVLFPDPWPKLRHNKHRIIQPAFLAALAERAQAGMPLYFRTDFKPYFDAARDTIATAPNWTLVSEDWSFEYATVFQQRAPSYFSLVARYHPGESGTISNPLET